MEGLADSGRAKSTYNMTVAQIKLLNDSGFSLAYASCSGANSSDDDAIQNIIENYEAAISILDKITNKQLDIA